MGKKKTVEVKTTNRSRELVHDSPTLSIKLGDNCISHSVGSIDKEVVLLAEKHHCNR